MTALGMTATLGLTATLRMTATLGLATVLYGSKDRNRQQHYKKSKASFHASPPEKTRPSRHQPSRAANYAQNIHLGTAARGKVS
jgi:hypothetical protein